MAAIFEGCGLSLTNRQLEQFWTYHGLLRSHNTELNLTRIHNFTNMVLKLYVDSALPAQLVDLPTPLMDLGSGAGMPGIPLKIMRPDLEVWLAEGRGKRVDFLREVIDRLRLEGVRVIDRKITPTFSQSMAGIITRAVETMVHTMERVQGCLQHGGRVIFMKGPGCEPEIAEARQHWTDRFALIQDQAYRIGRTSHARRLVVFERLDLPPRAMVARAARRHVVTRLESEQNRRFKDLKKLLGSRGIKKADQALMSGSRQVSEMLARFPERCLAWITSGDAISPPPESPERMHWLQLDEVLFQALDIFGTRGPLLCIQVPPMEPWEPAEGFTTGCNLLVPFQDPENIGAVIRSAAAFGVAQVILLAECAHPYHPKALRASGGLVPSVRLRQGPSLETLVPSHLPILALSPTGTPIDTVEFPPAFGLLAGLEGPGLPPAWRPSAVRIPMRPGVESLNAAAAAAVGLYEWARRTKGFQP